MTSSVLVSVRALLLTYEVIMRYKNEFVTLISGCVAVVLLGYLSYNAMVTRDVPVEKIVYQDKEVMVEVPKYITETITDTIYRDKFIPLYLSIHKSEFEEVFRHYRELHGPCSTFDWNGKLYSTRFKTEPKDICSPKIR